MKSVYCSKTGYTSITCSKIENSPYHLIFATKLNDSSILITIISWEYLNLSLANEYVSDVKIPTQFIKYDQCFSRRISQSDCSIHIKFNYNDMNLTSGQFIWLLYYIKVKTCKKLGICSLPLRLKNRYRND